MNVINDWPGCTSCNYGYTAGWNINSNCGVNVCVANINKEKETGIIEGKYIKSN